MLDSQNFGGQPKPNLGAEFMALKALIVFRGHYQILHSFIHSFIPSFIPQFIPKRISVSGESSKH